MEWIVITAVLVVIALIAAAQDERTSDEKHPYERKRPWGT